MTGLEHNGQPLRVHGYATIFDSGIRVNGQTEKFAPGAFDPSLRRGASYVRATINHCRADTWASVADGSLKLWQDSTGLAFSAMIPRTAEGRGLARMVADGETGASVLFRPSQTKPTPGGYIITAATLTDICLTTAPAYSTATWLSDVGLMRHMSEHAQDLRRRWCLGSMKNRTKMAPAAILSHMKRRTARSPLSINARARAAAVPSIWPMGFGLTDDQWRDFEFLESANRKMFRDAKAGQYALQRERNRCRRKVERAA